MTYPRPTFDFDFDKYVLDIKQDVETYIDWDVDMKFDVDIDKDIYVDADVDIDVDGNSSLIEAVIKDIGDNTAGVAVIGDTTAIEDTLSSAELTVASKNVIAQLTALAADNAVYKDSATFTEIAVGIDSVKGEFAILTLNMQSLVDNAHS